MAEVYKLEVRASIVKYNRDERNGPPYYDQWTNERLDVNETLDLGTMDFLQVCTVLGKFHEVAEEIKSQNGAVTS